MGLFIVEHEKVLVELRQKSTKTRKNYVSDILCLFFLSSHPIKNGDVNFQVKPLDCVELRTINGKTCGVSIQKATGPQQAFLSYRNAL